MFIKTIIKTDRKTGKQYKYYRLCKSCRIGDKLRHRTIMNMDKLEGINSKRDRKLLADWIERLIKREKQLIDVEPCLTASKQTILY